MGRADVTSITIFNREDDAENCCWARLHDMEIRLGDTLPDPGVPGALMTANSVCASYQGPPAHVNLVQVRWFWIAVAKMHPSSNRRLLSAPPLFALCLPAGHCHAALPGPRPLPFDSEEDCHCRHEQARMLPGLWHDPHGRDPGLGFQVRIRLRPSERWHMCSWLSVKALGCVSGSLFAFLHLFMGLAA